MIYPRRSSLAAAVAAALLLGGAHAAAQSADSAVAEALFRDAKQLMEHGKFADACPKLAESVRLERRVGTLLTLAICREKEGKTATAWAAYTDVVSLARRENRPEREKAAQERIAELEPKLSRLSINVPEALRAAPGLDVRRDGETVGSGAWGVAVPLDPGQHTVSVVATGKRAWTATVTLAPVSDRRVVELPPRLEDEAAAPPPPVASAPPPPVPRASAPPPAPAQPPPSPPERKSPALGYVIGGVGVVALGVGTIFLLRTASKQSDARDRCPTNACTDAEGVALNQSARSAYPIGVAGLVLGVAGVAAGTYLVLSSGAPSSSGASPSRALRASGSPSGGSLALEGTW